MSMVRQAMSFKYGLESMGFFIELKNGILFVLHVFAPDQEYAAFAESPADGGSDPGGLSIGI